MTARAFAPSEFIAPKMGNAFARASSGFAPLRSGLANAGVNFVKRMFNAVHALLPTSVIHATVARGRSSRGIETGPTTGDIVTGCRI